MAWFRLIPLSVWIPFSLSFHLLSHTETFPLWMQIFQTKLLPSTDVASNMMRVHILLCSVASFYIFWIFNGTSPPPLTYIRLLLELSWVPFQGSLPSHKRIGLKWSKCSLLLPLLGCNIFLEQYYDSICNLYQSINSGTLICCNGLK